MMVEGRGVQQQLLGMHDAVQAWRHQSPVSLVHDHWQALHVHWQEHFLPVCKSCIPLEVIAMGGPEALLEQSSKAMEAWPLTVPATPCNLKDYRVKT